MAKNWPDKDPDDVLDYGFDWSPRGFGLDVIASTTATVISGSVVIAQHQVTAIDTVQTGQGTVTWIRGGVDGETAEILLRITTQAGRQMDQTMKMKIVQR